MKTSTLRRHVRESFRSLGRNGWMTFASISAVTVTLMLVGVFAILMANLSHIASNLEQDVEIKVLIELTADADAEQQLLNEIAHMPAIAEYEYSSKEQELDQLIADFGDDWKLYEQSNPLHNVIYVRALNPEDIPKLAEEINYLSNTDDVVYGEDKVERLFKALSVARNVGLFLILGLLFTAVFLISNTIRITIIARGDEIEIMKLVGATNSFVRLPFLLEGMWLGMFGALIPMGLTAFLYKQLYDFVTPRVSGDLIELVKPGAITLEVAGLLLLLAVVIGVVGSFMSVRKFLRV
ncbi:permease-like cell division protein FtsX [Caryophanon latum]|uniref:Cell division protein FtsX n=1 Tax=Caryophanon latum TaxID=33977 RepID=A0A1C0Z2M1_9BACL|nr:permease-like cell division protein FtsX [Caryophanon latum]OCS93622.1 cell division protein FtsX [Caryophanon latum]